MKKSILFVALAGVLWAACGQTAFGQEVAGILKYSRWATKEEVLGKPLPEDSTMYIVAICQNVIVNQKADSITVKMVGEAIFTPIRVAIAGGGMSYALHSVSSLTPDWAMKNITTIVQPQGDMVAMGDITQKLRWRKAKSTQLEWHDDGKIAKVMIEDGVSYGIVVYKLVFYGFYVGPRP